MGFEHIARVIVSWGIDLFVQFFLIPAVGFIVGIPAVMLIIRFERLSVNAVLLSAFGLAAIGFFGALLVIYGGADKYLGYPG